MSSVDGSRLVQMLVLTEPADFMVELIRREGVSHELIAMSLFVTVCLRIAVEGQQGRVHLCGVPVLLLHAEMIVWLEVSVVHRVVHLLCVHVLELITERAWKTGGQTS